MIQRKIYKDIKKYLNTKEVIVLHGARQVGKTSLMNIISENLPTEDFTYIDLEDSRYLDICNQGPEAIIAHLKQKKTLGKQKKFFLLIDEIQYLNAPSSFLKLFHDHHPDFKLIVSGSSSFDIKNKFKDSLVGRTIDFEIFQLDFEEFLSFKGYKVNLFEQITSEKIIKELSDLYREYVCFGGYPKITLEDNVERKEKYLQQIIDTYIKKDIRDLANIRDITKFNKLINVLAGQSGQLLNVTELSNTAGLSKQTIEEYLFLLENTYIIKRVHPFSRNLRSELFKVPKIYFYDSGLTNLLINKTLTNTVTGSMLETSVFSDLIKNIPKEYLFYWRTQDKKEIDFIVDGKKGLKALEIKNNVTSFSNTAMNYFMGKYKKVVAFCVYLEGKPKLDVGITPIRPWDLFRVGSLW